MRSAPW